MKKGTHVVLLSYDINAPDRIQSANKTADDLFFSIRQSESLAEKDEADLRTTFMEKIEPLL